MLRLALIALTLTACASTEQRTRTALETVGAVVDPAYEAAMSGCAAKADALVEELRAHGFKQAYQDARDKLVERCGKTRDAFEVIRALHDEAAKLVEAGKLKEARDVLAKLLSAWAALKGGDDVRE
jgi:prophage DNA circulation protein